MVVYPTPPQRMGRCRPTPARARDPSTCPTRHGSVNVYAHQLRNFEAPRVSCTLFREHRILPRKQIGLQSRTIRDSIAVGTAPVQADAVGYSFGLGIHLPGSARSGHRAILGNGTPFGAAGTALHDDRTAGSPGAGRRLTARRAVHRPAGGEPSKTCGLAAG